MVPCVVTIRCNPLFEGNHKQISLGTYPGVSLKEARRLLASGIDPSAHRKTHKAGRAQRSVNTFEAVAREWSAKHAPNWAPVIPA